MKKLLVVFSMVFAFGVTSAKDLRAVIGYTKNGADGYIVLTAVPCNYGTKQAWSGKFAYTQAPRFITQYGCWRSDELMVHIDWDGEVGSRSYLADIFTMLEQAPTKKGAAL